MRGRRSAGTVAGHKKGGSGPKPGRAATGARRARESRSRGAIEVEQARRPIPPGQCAAPPQRLQTTGFKDSSPALGQPSIFGAPFVAASFKVHPSHHSRLEVLTRELPFAIDDSDAAGRAYVRWLDTEARGDLDVVQLWAYSYTIRYFYAAFARERTSGASDLDAAIDQAYDRILRSLLSVHEPHKFAHYVSVICRNVLNTHRSRRREMVELDEDILLVTEGGARDYDRVVMARALDRAVDALPPAIREVAQMRLIERAPTRTSPTSPAGPWPPSARSRPRPKRAWATTPTSERSTTPGTTSASSVGVGATPNSKTNPFWRLDPARARVSPGESPLAVTDLDRLLDDYPVLSTEERADADHRLAAHPERAAEWADARRLAELLDAARLDPEDDLAQRAVERRMRGERPDEPDDDPESARIEARLDQFEDQAEDPVARFERMTGQTLEPSESRTELASGDSVPARPFVLTAPPRSSRLPSVSAALAVLVAVYGGLWVVSVQSATPRDRLADLGGIEAQAPPVPPSASGNASADSLTGALRTVRQARRSVLLLFPRYSPAALDAAAVRLAKVAGQADAGTWVSQEARLALGRVHLARQRDLQAARVLAGLVREGGYRAPAARRLLDAIRAGLD